MKLAYYNKIYEKLNFNKNDLIRWVQMIAKGFMPHGNWELSAQIYSNYNVWEIGILEATKSLVKKYKKKGIRINREIKDGKKTVLVEFPDELKDEILDQLLPEHLTLEELKAKMIKRTRDFIAKMRSEKMLEYNYDIAYSMYEKHKDEKDDLKKRFTYWYFFKIMIYAELEKVKA